MKTIPGDLLQDLARVRSTSPWLELLDFTLPNGSHYRVANNTEPVTYAGNVYQASAYTPEVLDLGKDARMPTFVLRLSNVSGALAGWLHRTGGLEGQTVTAILVNANNLAADYSEFTTSYDIRGHSDDEETIEFEIGGPNLYRWRFPFRRYMPDLCDVRFKSALCGYSGAETSCTYLLGRCRELNNGDRFGGTPGLAPQALRLV